MFGIDWNEMLIIGVVALVVIGPKELPGVLRTLGQSLNKLRKMAANFRTEFDQAMKEADLQDLKESADSLRSTVGTLRGATSPMSMIKSEILGIGDTVKDAVAEPKPVVAAPAPTTPTVATPQLPSQLPSQPPAVVAEIPNIPVVPAPVVLPEPPAQVKAPRQKAASSTIEKTTAAKPASAKAAAGKTKSVPAKAPAAKPAEAAASSSKSAAVKSQVPASQAATVEAPVAALAKKRTRKSAGAEA